MTSRENAANIRWEEEDPSELPEFDVDLREKIIDHEVIDQGHQLQFTLDRTIVTPDMFEETIERVTPAIEALNRGLSEARIQGLPAGVRGPNCILPEVIKDFEHKAIIIQPMGDAEQRAKLAKTSVDTDTIRSPFVGYGLRFRRNPELPGTFIPQLVYQLSLRERNSYSAYIMPMATGDVGISKLFFELDERRDARKEILKHLFDAVGEHGDIADRINRSFVETERYTSDFLRAVGREIDGLINLLHGAQQRQGKML